MKIAQKLLKFKSFISLVSIILALVLLLIITFLSSLPRINLLTILENTRQNLFPESQAHILIEDNKLKIRFKIQDTDKEKVTQFSKNLGIDDRWIEGLSFQVNKESLELIDQNLPASVNLEFQDKKLQFSSFTSLALNSSLPSKKYILATESARLTLRSSSDENYDLLIEDPYTLLNFATSSGRLTLSKELENLFPILTKIATIKIKVTGKSLNGVITLK